MEKVILLKPYFSHTIWGGKRLREEFGYNEPGDDIGECWGISAHPSGESVAASGEYKGFSLSELWDEHRELFGGMEGDRFPLLVKIIDANKDLSIQVRTVPLERRSAGMCSTVRKTENWLRDTMPHHVMNSCA